MPRFFRSSVVLTRVGILLLLFSTPFALPAGAEGEPAAPVSSSSAPAAEVQPEPSAPAPVPAAAPATVSEDDGIVSAIRFEGLILNKPRSLERKIKTRRNQPVDRKRLNEDVKILFETGDFDDVSVGIARRGERDSKGRSQSVVTFTVVERPIIKRIDYKGYKKVRPSSYDDKVQSKQDNPFDKYKAQLDERSILEYYRNEGYADAKVEHYTSVDPSSRKLILTFFIVEGERILVRSIDLAGSRRFSAKKLRKKMKTRRKKVYKEDVFREDQKAITDFYRNNGYLDANVSTSSVSIDQQKNEAALSLQVEEGPLYQIGSISFEGATIFDEKELRKAVVLKKGIFRQNLLDESVANINNLYADRGYLRTEVQALPERRQEAGAVDFKISIQESSVVYVDGVYVDGNSYTKTYVIKREVLLKPGDVFSAGRMRRSVEKIYNLGFLDDVQVDVQQPKDPNLADLIFNVKEGKPGVFSVGAGFSSVDRFVGNLQLQHTNLFGKAQRIDVQYEFGARRQNFEIGWTDPWFLGYNMSGGVDLFNTVRVRNYLGNGNTFRERRRGSSLRLGPRLTDDLGLFFAYTIQTTEVYGVDSAIKKDLFKTYDVPEEEALSKDSVSRVKSSFVSEIAYDNRDNRFDATRGGRHSASVELAGGPFGGDSHFIKPQLTSSYYVPSFWKFVFSLNARMAWINKFSPSADVQTSERFFLGGPDTIRGYNYNAILPRVFARNNIGDVVPSNTPGRILSIVNAEYKFPIVQERGRTIFQGAFFLDVGGTWLRSQDIHFTTGSKDDRMKAGAGFGFRFKTPVFPIRLDFGFPLNPRPKDKFRDGDSRGLQPYFTIGNIF